MPTPLQRHANYPGAQPFNVAPRPNKKKAAYYPKQIPQPSKKEKSHG